MIRFLILALMLPGSTIVRADAAARGKELALKGDRLADEFAKEASRMEMIITNAHKDRVVRELEMKVLEQKDDGDKTLITVIKPADVKGTRLLTWTHIEGDDDQWLYLPSIRRKKRIRSSSKTGSFMGSEFSYEDMSSQEVEKYTYRFIKEDKVGNSPALLTERIPKDKKSGYSKQLVWQSQQHYQALKIEYYDRKGSLLKVATFGAYKKMQQKPEVWRTASISMENRQTKKSSEIIWHERKMGAQLDFTEKSFSKHALDE